MAKCDSQYQPAGQADRFVRADFDRHTIVVYQAYNRAIAAAALTDGQFATPFSWNRMTWIKPSFLWLMARSNWGRKSGQEHILGIRITRQGWDTALQRGVLTHYVPQVHGSIDRWQRQIDSAAVHVQWDPERTINGKKLDRRAIQVGLSRAVIRDYTDNWITEIRDLTPLTRKIRGLIVAGKHRAARDLLPPEKRYPVDSDTAARLGIQG